MADSTLNRFVSSGTAAQRAAFTPTPPTPSSGPSPGYFWFETDTNKSYSWDGAAWELTAVPISVGTVAPSSPNTNDLWVDTN